MKIERSITINATPQQVQQFLASPEYISQLNASPDNRAIGIVSVTEVDRTPQEGELTEQTIRYEATTRLPGFLKKYEAKAPSTVAWQENYRWDNARNQATFHIVADAPTHWHQRYSSAGKLTLTPHDGGTRLVRELEFKINVFGLGKIIEKALSSEIETIFDARNKLILANFESI